MVFLYMNINLSYAHIIFLGYFKTSQHHEVLLPNEVCYHFLYCNLIEFYRLQVIYQQIRFFNCLQGHLLYRIFNFSNSKLNL